MNFLFESFDLITFLVGLGVLAALMLLNEFARRYKYVALTLFIIIPIIFTIFVWPKTAVAGSSVGSWFHWAKLYSVLAAALSCLAISYWKKAAANKYVLMLPAIILAINIAEAVLRDFEVYSIHGMDHGMMLNGGPWNIMNGIAGILNIIAISGWMGIFASKGKTKDVIWPDQIWVWVIAYDFWNFAYTYNCVPDHSWYAGLLLLLASVIPFLIIKKGAWFQHRAFTLAFWMMFVMSYPAFVDTSAYAVKSTNNDTMLFIVSFIALLANVILIVYHVYRIIKKKINPLKSEVYTDTAAYKTVIAENS
jgi:hypothetical protein